MEEESKSKAKCSTKPVSKKDSLVIFGLSLVLFALLIVRVEFVNRRAEVMEAKLEKRIERIEEEMQGKVHSMRCYRQSGTLRNEAQEILQTWVSLKQLHVFENTGRSNSIEEHFIKQGQDGVSNGFHHNFGANLC